MKYLYWFLLLIPSIIIGWSARLISPIACMFITRAPYYTTVKRYGKTYQLLDRDRLVWWLTWFDTDDNATDEFWYGIYSTTKTQEYYDTHRVYRWWCRVMWLQRNSMYTFNRKFFGLKKDSPLAWQYKGNSLIKGRTINIGFKAHKGIDRLMLAGRFI